MKLQRKDVINGLAKRSGFYKKYMDDILDALEDFLIDSLSEATIDEEVEIQLVKGLTIGAVKNPSRDGKDPRNQKDIMIPERILPYAKFTQTFKQKINE